MPSDSEYLEQLIERGRAFGYRSARTTDPFDRAEQISTHRWTEWLTEAHATVNRLASPNSEASAVIRKARHLEAFGVLAEEFYESRELAIRAILMCAATLSPAAGVHQGVGPMTSAYIRMWNSYGREILIGVAATVIGGVLLALLL